MAMVPLQATSEAGSVTTHRDPAKALFASRTAAATTRIHAIGAILGIAILKLMMLAALFTETEPFPPLRFAPLFSASLAASVFAIALIVTRSRAFVIPVVLVILESLLSVGPQKLYPGESDFFAQTPAVYPVILTGTALLIALGVSSYRLARASDEEADGV